MPYKSSSVRLPHQIYVVTMHGQKFLSDTFINFFFFFLFFFNILKIWKRSLQPFRSWLQGISVQHDKYKIIITVGLSYMRKHSRWLACCHISTIWVSSKKNCFYFLIGDMKTLLLVQETFWTNRNGFGSLLNKQIQTNDDFSQSFLLRQLWIINHYIKCSSKNCCFFVCGFFSLTQWPAPHHFY